MIHCLRDIGLPTLHWSSWIGLQFGDILSSWRVFIHKIVFSSNSSFLVALGTLLIAHQKCGHGSGGILSVSWTALAPSTAQENDYSSSPARLLSPAAALDGCWRRILLYPPSTTTTTVAACDKPLCDCWDELR